jgi:HSP20 family protein
MSQRWDPIRDLMVLQDRMNELFEDASKRRARAGSEDRDSIEHADWMPAADVYEEAELYVVALDLPGVDRSALEIDIENNQLLIRGNRTSNGRAEHRNERPRGKFARTFDLPPSIDQKRIEAEYKDGVLYVRIGKRIEQKAQRVEIKVS